MKICLVEVEVVKQNFGMPWILHKMYRQNKPTNPRGVQIYSILSLGCSTFPPLQLKLLTIFCILGLHYSTAIYLWS